MNTSARSAKRDGRWTLIGESRSDSERSKGKYHLIISVNPFLKSFSWIDIYLLFISALPLIYFGIQEMSFLTVDQF